MITDSRFQSLKTTGVMHWLWAAGSIGLLGLALLATALAAPTAPPLFIGLAFGGAAAIELAAGIGLYRRGGAGMAPVFSGATGLAMVSMLFFYWWIVPQSRSAGTVTMLFGIFCISSAFTRGLDLAFDHPVAPLSEALAALTSLVVGAIALYAWHDASFELSAWLVGVELMSTALALTGAAWSLWVHPELPGYDDPLLR